jgi:uncharacterized membrane protein
VAAPAQQDQVLFEAVIVPHRSLGPRGLKVLSVAALAACVITSVVFVALGAWPVGLFAGGELLLAVALFRLHMRAARASEMLLLTQEGLRVVRTTPSGAVSSRSLPADWMSVRLEERPGRVPALLLTAQGVEEEVGRDLGEAAKRDLAESLSAALHRRRNPVFDNPQLR